jgi:glycosyltransferase involved in cell wall biosynthesis
VIQDARLMALLYAAADALVVPSEQDNLPNAVMEALACGTPTAAFRIGGIPDMVEHTVTGYLAPPFDARALADGIAWLIDDRDRAQQLSAEARRRAVQRYAAEVIAMRYATLYADVCLGNGQI